MKLFLLRHAKAHDTWPDSERALSKVGREQVSKLCSVLDANAFANVVQIWHSPYARALQTAEIFKEKTGISAELVPTATITPEDNPYETARLIASISCFDKDLMIVSHNPMLENLADILLEGSKRGGRIVFRKCTLASLTLEFPPALGREYGVWSIDTLISPAVINEK